MSPILLKQLRPALMKVLISLVIVGLIWLVNIVSVSILLATMTDFNLSVWDWMLMSFKDPRTALYAAPVCVVLLTYWHTRNKKKKA